MTSISVMQLISSLQVGGAEKLLLSLLESALADQAVNYVVVVMNDEVNADLMDELEGLGHEVYCLGRPQGHRSMKYIFQLLAIALKHRVQIIHSHNQGSTAWAMLCKIFLPYLKVVTTVHDTPNISRLSAWRLRCHRWLVDMNIAISRSVEEECRKHALFKHTLIYNGIRINRFSVTRGSLPDSRPLVLVNVARMNYTKKGQDVLIKAVRLCRQHGLNVRCLLVGSVCEESIEQYEYLKALVQDFGMEDQVEFILNRTDVPEILKQADVFVLPSRYEGFGLVILEAMASGLPVIASEIDGPAELVKNGQTGYLFNSGDEQALFEKIRAIYNNPAHAHSMAVAAKDDVEQFDISRMREAYHALYQSLIHFTEVESKIEWRFQNEPSV